MFRLDIQFLFLNKPNLSAHLKKSKNTNDGFWLTAVDCGIKNTRSRKRFPISITWDYINQQAKFHYQITSDSKDIFTNETKYSRTDQVKFVEDSL